MAIRHTFSICAYKDSPYLEECIISIKNQTVRSAILLCTSTPSPYIQDLAEKYSIDLNIREGTSDIRDDWNYAYNMAHTDYVTVAHQDDIYRRDYTCEIMNYIEASRTSPLIAFTDYLPLKSHNNGKRDINSILRRLLRTPLKFGFLSDKQWVKKQILSLGNSICCPTVTYNKQVLGTDVFTSNLKFNIDWDTFYKLACQKGRFLYIDKPLVQYRIHDNATTKTFIQDNGRYKEDIIMFRKFWPKWITSIIMKLYVKAYDTYQ